MSDRMKGGWRDMTSAYYYVRGLWLNGKVRGYSCRGHAERDQRIRAFKAELPVGSRIEVLREHAGYVSDAPMMVWFRKTNTWKRINPKMT